MTNHVHLLVTLTQTLGIAEMMQVLGRRYVYYINKTYHRTGTLWEGRYKKTRVREEWHLLKALIQIFRHFCADGKPGIPEKPLDSVCEGMT